MESLAPLSAPRSLTELRADMCSPGVIPAEVDTLFVEMARPVEGEAALRERADFLQSLMTLPGVGSQQTGSDGITVSTAAVETLLELGYPYALEVPPNLLERAREERDAQRRRKKKQQKEQQQKEQGAEPLPVAGIVVTLFGTALQLLPMLLPLLRTGSRLDVPGFIVMILLLGICVPPAMALMGALMRHRTLQGLGAVGLVLQGLAWLAITLFMSSMSSYGLLLLAWPTWYALLGAAQLIRPSKLPETPPAVEPTKPQAPEAATS
ncbi:hypothetical protein A176_007139 [Myxococcus hansupus]|uniref:Uncharacterized protein n=1 Tax=Pseudomyxococcus hansupus TaxID=1297742 RepID=A0A0H4XPC9_9BACT|nr:hypothetical protein A176_007139 [Myxococcus hansupus]